MVQDKFPDNNPYVQTQATLLAVNNDVEFHVAIEEATQVRATQLNITNSNVNRVHETPMPTVTTVGQNTTSAALANIDQPPVPPEDRAVDNCFLGNTLFTYWDGETTAEMSMEQLFMLQERPFAFAFDEDDVPVQGVIEQVFCSRRKDYVHVTFEDYTADDVAPTHPYWTLGGYVPIKDLLDKFVYDIENNPLKVLRIDWVEVPGGINVYNMHVKKYMNYVANGRKCHNLKPVPDLEAA